MNDNVEIILFYLFIYFVLMNIIASIMAIADKSKAKRDKWRIPEATLMLVGLFGGAIGEYITMKKIRHKTKHAKFMIGLPIEIFLHLIIIVLIISKVAFI